MLLLLWCIRKNNVRPRCTSVSTSQLLCPSRGKHTSVKVWHYVKNLKHRCQWCINLWPPLAREDLLIINICSRKICHILRLCTLVCSTFKNRSMRRHGMNPNLPKNQTKFQTLPYKVICLLQIFHLLHLWTTGKLRTTHP